MAMLMLEERLACMFAIQELVLAHHTQDDVAPKLGISQQAVSQAARRAKLGPAVTQAVQKYYKTDRTGLIAKYRRQIDVWLAENPDVARANVTSVAEVSPTVLAIADSTDWVEETTAQLELFWRASGGTAEPSELKLVGAQYDAINRAAHDRRELVRFRSNNPRSR